MFELADALTKAHIRQKDKGDEYSLQVALEGGKKAVLQGSMNVLLVMYEILCSVCYCSFNYGCMNIQVHLSRVYTHDT